MALKKRIVVVGAGSIGKRHARLLLQRPELQVELCDPDRQALSGAQEQLGELPVYGDFDEMLGTHPDMVLVASPHQLHTRHSVAALEAGAHVLCEKPMADRLESALEAFEVSGKADKVVSYGFSNHFNPGMVRIRELIDGEHLGEILYVHFHVGTYATLVNSRSRYQEHTEAALLMDYVHQPDLLYWMLGKNPVGVYAAGGFGGDVPLKSNPNVITMLLDYDTQTTACINLNYLQYPDRYHCEFIGDRGWVYYDLMNNELTIGDAVKAEARKETIAFERDEIYVAEHQAFLDAVAGKREPESPPVEALQSMIVLEAALRSWKTRQRVLLEDIYR